MKISIEQMKEMVTEVISEAKKKKKKKGDDSPLNPLDFSEPLGELNLYKRQGASNIGPFTEHALRTVIKRMLREALGEIEIKPVDKDKTKVSSPYTGQVVSKDSKDTVVDPKLADSKWKPGKGAWEQADHWYSVEKKKNKDAK